MLVFPDFSEVRIWAQLVFPALSPVVEVEEGKEGADEAKEGSLKVEKHLRFRDMPTSNWKSV